MSLNTILKRSFTIMGMYKDLTSIRVLISQIKRKKIINQYLYKNTIRKLQVGSSISNLEDWLASDLIPTTSNCIMLDATKKFPFSDNTFDYIYSEHMIEHITWDDGQKMLLESFRILKPGGKIRIATPNMSTFVGFYTGKTTKTSEKYIEWITEKYIKGIDMYKPAFVLNNLFKNWNHQFIYDQELLGLALQKSGFKDIKTVSYGCSDDVNLQDLEHHGEHVGNIEMAKFETLVMEAVKYQNNIS